MHVARGVLLLVVAAVCAGRRIHHTQLGSQQMLLIDLPEQRDIDQAEATRPSPQAAADDATKLETQGQAEEKAEEAAAEAAEEEEAEAAAESEEVEAEVVEEVVEEAEEKTEQRPPRIVKRQCYGCAEVVCSCPDCDRR